MKTMNSLPATTSTLVQNHIEHPFVQVLDQAQ